MTKKEKLLKQIEGFLKGREMVYLKASYWAVSDHPTGNIPECGLVFGINSWEQLEKLKEIFDEDLIKHKQGIIEIIPNHNVTVDFYIKIKYIIEVKYSSLDL